MQDEFDDDGAAHAAAAVPEARDTALEAAVRDTAQALHDAIAAVCKTGCRVDWPGRAADLADIAVRAPLGAPIDDAAVTSAIASAQDVVRAAAAPFAAAVAAAATAGYRVAWPAGPDGLPAIAVSATAAA